MVARRTRGVARLTAAALVAAPSARAHTATAHPLHTSLAEVTYDATARTVNVSLRVFVDDFSSAVIRGKPADPTAAIVVPPDTAMFRYVTGKFALFDHAGRAMPLRWCGTRRAGALLFICLRTPASAPPAGARARNAVLAELFADQVNIVQASLGGGRQTVLFTRGDSVKALH